MQAHYKKHDMVTVRILVLVLRIATCRHSATEDSQLPRAIAAVRLRSVGETHLLDSQHRLISARLASSHLQECVGLGGALPFCFYVSRLVGQILGRVTMDNFW